MEAVTECQHQGRSLNAISVVKNQGNRHQTHQEIWNSKNMGEERGAANE